MPAATAKLDLWAIREAVALALDGTVTGLRSMAWMPDQIPVGALLVAAVSPATDGDYVSYYQSFGRGSEGWLTDIHLRVVVISATADTRTAQQRLDWALSAGVGVSTSVIDALVTDKTLGGAVDHCVPLTAGAPYMLALQGDVRLWAADIPLSIKARRG